MTSISTIDVIIPHLVSTPPPDGTRLDYSERFATEVIPRLKAELGI